MRTATALYAEGKLLTAPLAADPSITLIENGPDFFGVILARGCTQPSWGSALFLEDVLWFRASARDFKVTEHLKVCLSEKEDLFVASDVEALKVFPNPSRTPYVTLFFPGETVERLRAALSQGKGGELFGFVQRHFGTLPGFVAKGKELTTPKGYAEASAVNVPMLSHDLMTP